MTTRDELHELIDALDPARLDEAAAVLRELGEGLGPHAATGMPASLGLGNSGRGDLSERADELLEDGGFGQP